MPHRSILPRIARALALGLALTLAATATASNPGQAAADQVSLDSYRDFLDFDLYTHVGDNRGPSGPEHDPCRDNIYDIFDSYGLPVVLDPFSYGGGTYENVVATLTGSVYPDQQYIIGAHYDSVSNPGADDNASGVALVLEAARILSQYDSEYTIIFIAFDMEEQGLIGSEHYVANHLDDDILGMVSADMVAYDPNTNHCNIYGRTASDPIKNTFAAAVAEYGDGLTYTIGGDTPYSDHAPFEAEGFQACLLIEGEVWNNPYYHTQQDNFDNPDNLNFEYAVKMVRSTVGWLVDNANVNVQYDGLDFTYPDGHPDLIAPNGRTRMRVEIAGAGNVTPQAGSGVLHYDDGSGWQSVPMQQLTPNVYDAVFQGGPCGDDIHYYLSAAGFGPSGPQVFTDPWHAPESSYVATAAYGETVFYEETLDADPGWSAEPDWAFGQPTGQGGAHGSPDPNSGYTGLYVYGYNLNGDYPNDLLQTHLTSDPIDCTGMLAVHLNFYRWLGVEQPDYDHAYVRVSNNGSSWTTVWENGSEIADTSWNEIDLDVSATADDQPNLYLRWTMGSTDGGWTYCGWNIDDVRLTALKCEAGPLGDLNCDGSINGLDIDPFVLTLTGAPDFDDYYFAHPDCDPLLADCNADGSINGLDIDPFVDLLTAQ